MEINTQIEFRGRTYRLLYRSPYTRIDGGKSEVLTWLCETGCKTCGAPYKIKTGRNPRASKYLDLANCPAHRRGLAPRSAAS